MLVVVARPRVYCDHWTAKRAAAESGVAAVIGASQAFYLDTGEYPRGLMDLVSRPAGAKVWRGPYLAATKLIDPWDEEYRYELVSKPLGPRIMSLGPDGLPNTKDDIVSE